MKDYILVPSSSDALGEGRVRLQDESRPGSPSGSPTSVTSKLSSHFRRHQRKYILPALVLLGLLGVLVVLHGSTSTIDSDHLKSLSAQVSSYFNPPASSTSSSSEFSRIQHWKTAEDVYSQPGFLQIHSNHEAAPMEETTRFLPLSLLDELADSGMTGFEREVAVEDGFSELRKVYDVLSGRVAPDADNGLEYLQNKTILLIGDSIDRNQIEYMCTKVLKGQSSVKILHEAPYDLSPFQWDDRYVRASAWSEPRVCHFPRASAGDASSSDRDREREGAMAHSVFGGTEIWQLMTYGVLAQEETWKFKSVTVEPQQTKAKIMLFAEAFEKLGKKPDLILTHSILWDLATTNLEDAKAEVPARERLSLETVSRFKQETLALLGVLNDLWPSAIKMYRRQHAVHADSGTWYLEDLEPKPAAIPRQPYSANKLAQLNNVVDSLLLDHQDASSSLARTSATGGNDDDPSRSGFWSFDIRHVSQEYMQDFPDSRHFGKVGKLLYTQMLLHYMRHLL